MDFQFSRRELMKTGGVLAGSLNLLTQPVTATQDVRQLTYGERKTGQIDTTDPTYPYSADVMTYAEPITFTGEAGDEVMLVVTGDELPGVALALEAPDKTRLKTGFKKNPPGSELFSEFTFGDHSVLHESGDHTYWIGTYPQGTGQYEVTLNKVGTGHRLQLNDQLENRLDTSDVPAGGYDAPNGKEVTTPTFADQYILSGEKNQTVYITVKTNGFTPRLIYSPHTPRPAPIAVKSAETGMSVTVPYTFSDDQGVHLLVTATDSSGAGAYTIETTTTPLAGQSAAIQAFIPTVVADSGRPQFDKASKHQYRKVWMIDKIGESWEWKVNNSPPDWVTKFTDSPSSDQRYLRLPGFLVVSAPTAAPDTALFENISIDFLSNATVLGVETEDIPSTLTPGRYPFHVVCRLSPNPSFGYTVNWGGKLSLSGGIPSGSPLAGVVQRSSAWDATTNRFSLTTNVPYGVKYGTWEAFGGAIKQGIYDLLELLTDTVLNLVSFGTVGSGQFELMRELGEELGQTILEEVAKHYFDPIEIITYDGVTVTENITSDTLHSAAVGTGTAFTHATIKKDWIGTQEIGLSGPALIAAPED